MSRAIHVLWAGRHRRSEWERLCDRYRSRIGHTLPVRERAIKVRVGGDRLAAEAEALTAALPDPGWAVALDRRGRAMSSRRFSLWLERLQRDWPHPVAFVLGSDLGLGKQLLDSCRERLSLGPMTLPHELARLVLYEQLYRALCIQAGIKYHREPL